MSARKKQKNTDGLSPDPRRAVQELLETIGVVHDVYTRETAALERQDIKGFLSLQDEKLKRVGLYRGRVEELLTRKGEMRDVDMNLKMSLERAQAAFAALSASNARALKKMQRTTERLGGKIQDIAKDSINKSQAFSYGQSGTFDAGKKKRVSIGVSETA